MSTAQFLPITAFMGLTKINPHSENSSYLKNIEIYFFKKMIVFYIKHDRAKDNIPLVCKSSIPFRDYSFLLAVFKHYPLKRHRQLTTQVKTKPGTHKAYRVKIFTKCQVETLSQ